MSEQRAGIGYDTHRVSAVRTLVLGGVELPGVPGLHGFSDSDVLAHAVIDAVLGAAGLGDIGRHFPDTDPRYAGADSIELLREAVARVSAEGWRVGNVDATVICEEPRISPHAGEMAGRLADALGVEPARVSVKGTTNEGMGFVGRGEGIAAIAVAMIARIEER
jgi:2-C-methyl-D-erythritol 4-phosphate cytidylyltransferase/2-C-methyl-D-erythritol 2,4-cyclodiphosphate synthase